MFFVAPPPSNLRGKTWKSVPYTLQVSWCVFFYCYISVFFHCYLSYSLEKLPLGPVVLLSKSPNMWLLWVPQITSHIYYHKRKLLEEVPPEKLIYKSSQRKMYPGKSGLDPRIHKYRAQDDNCVSAWEELVLIEATEYRKITNKYMLYLRFLKIWE